MKNMMILLNKEEKVFGHVLNGLCHISFGLGHKIPIGKLPNISVRFASTKEIYVFRQKAFDLFNKNKKLAFYSDFITAMNSVMEFKDHIDYVKSFKENELTYLGVCFCSDEKLTDELITDFRDMPVLKNYQPLIATEDKSMFEFCSGVAPNYEKPAVPKKIIMSLHPKESLHILLNHMVVAAIELGRKVPREQLNIMPWVDKDGNEHFNISLHPFPILMAKKNEIQKSIIDEMHEKNSELYCHASSDLNQNLLAVCGFGEVENISKVFNKEKCGLWRKSPGNKDFILDTVVFYKLIVGSQESKKLESITKKDHEDLIKESKVIKKDEQKSKLTKTDKLDISPKKAESTFFQGVKYIEINTHVHESMKVAKKLVNESGSDENKKIMDNLLEAYEKHEMSESHFEQLQILILSLLNPRIKLI